MTELGQVAERSPAQAVRLGVSQYLDSASLRTQDRLCRTPTEVPWHCFTSPSPPFNLSDYDASPAVRSNPPRRLAMTPISARSPVRKFCVTKAICNRPWIFWTISLDQRSRPPSTTTSEVPRSPLATANFDEVLRLYNRALQYDDHHPGALVWPGSGERSQGQRRGSIATVRAGRFLFSSARRNADQPGRGVRGSQRFLPRLKPVTSESWMSIPTIPGLGCT